jgi:hypothetical protein
MAALEHQDLNLQPGREHEWWDGAHHHWNCHHDRVAELLQQCGFTEIQDLFDVIPKSPAMKGWKDGDIHWPIVGHWHWHFAIGCVNSK